MNKRNYAILIAIMSIAVIGILLIQILWLNKGINEREETFKQNIHTVLSTTTDKIRKNEQQKVYKELENLQSVIKSKQRNQSLGVHNEKKTSSQASILEDYFNIMLSKASLEKYIQSKANTTPIEQRTSYKKTDSILSSELQKLQIDIKYEFAILNYLKKSTSIKSTNFQLSKNSISNPLFYDNQFKTSFFLVIDFPEKSIFLKAPIWGQFTLSFLLILVILTVFAISLHHLISQKKISEIKNDFINNVTHEFKTPIATINVAVDALKNPLINSNIEKINNYADLIKKENKRLNEQVEMILQISRLEKNQLELNLEVYDLNQVVESSIDSVRLIIENRNGHITENYTTTSILVKIDIFHFINIISTILDNANKYSPESPDITVTVFEENEHAIINISDKGKGMTKEVQNKVFVQFYREESGNIHNVKGYGLGLSYAQKIIKLHKGIITVKSELHKGTTFTIKIPKHIKK